MIDGISLRDYFAGQVLAAFLTHPTFSVVTIGGETFTQACARLSYEHADAMMKERLKP